MWVNLAYLDRNINSTTPVHFPLHHVYKKKKKRNNNSKIYRKKRPLQQNDCSYKNDIRHYSLVAAKRWLLLVCVLSVSGGLLFELWTCIDYRLTGRMYGHVTANTTIVPIVSAMYFHYSIRYRIKREEQFPYRFLLLELNCVFSFF